MPLQQKFYCPQCERHMPRRPAGKCPHCGADVRRHVDQERERETMIEKVVAVLSTILVLGLSLFAGGCTVVEGVVAYAVAGAIIWYWGTRTFGKGVGSE
jgi:hypothetical protein